MNLRALCSAFLGLMCLDVARAATPLGAQLEISALLEDIGSSGCEFYRNGS